MHNRTTIASLAVLAACASAASAQTDFARAAATNGFWGSVSEWTPNGVPGFNSPDDTARLGLTGEYIVNLSGFGTRTVARLTIANPDATLRLSPSGAPVTLSLNLGSLTNAGTIEVVSGNTRAVVSIESGAVGGTVFLNSVNANTLAAIGGPTTPGTSIRFSEDAIVFGSGRIEGRVSEFAGTLRPGLPTGSMNGVVALFLPSDQQINFTETTVLEIGLASSGSRRIEGVNGPLQLAGTLRVNAIDGFDPAGSGEYNIISGVGSFGSLNGEFDTVEYNGPLDEGETTRIFYEPDRVVFGVTCDADVVLPIGTLDIFDILAFLDIWNAQTEGADFNNSGSVDIFDVLDFLTQWSTGCPG